MLSLNFQDVFVVVTSIVLTTAIIATVGRKIRKIDFSECGQDNSLFGLQYDEV